MDQHKWRTLGNAVLVQPGNGARSFDVRDGNAQVPMPRYEPELFDKTKVSLHLVQVVRSTAELVREGSTAEFLRLTGAKRYSGKVADISGNMRRLAERREDHCAIELPLGEHGDQRAVTLGIRRRAP